MSILAVVIFLISIVATTTLSCIFAVIFVMLKLGVPFASTPHRHTKTVLEELGVTNNTVFYDLGCGDGRLVIAAAKQGAQATGFELSPWAYCKARWNTLVSRSAAKIKCQNFYTSSLANADAIFCFLLGPIMPKISRKLQNELRSGTRIVCYGFPLPDWEPTKIIAPNPENPRASKLFVYKKI